jgi:transposase
MSEGGKAAIQADDEVVAAGLLGELEGRIRDLERLLGRKTMEVEILREALSAARGRSPSGSCSRRHRGRSASRSNPDEGRGRHPGRSPLQLG